MRLTELVKNQRITIQLLWGEQKIEFFSTVVEKDDSAVYVTPYLNKGAELELNLAQGKGIICNLYTINPVTKQRISWKNVELTTITRNEGILYCLKTNGYNHIAKNEDRRKHDRIIVQINALLFDGQSEEGMNVIVHDISDVGISFYAPKSFAPSGNVLTVKFSDMIGARKFDIKVECMVARMGNKAGNQFVGCRIISDNKDYQLYGFMKSIKDK